jgi:carbon-monoxide dehydrogenase medium subunit
VAGFQYLRPTNLEDAIAILNTHGPDARLLSGGTDLLVRLRLGHIRPAVVVDLKRVAALDTGIEERGNTIRIGARTVMTDIIADARIQHHYPGLVEAARVVGSVQIRNRATLAGNICNASPAADTAPALLVYGATVLIAGPDGERRVALGDFFIGPGKTVLKRGDLVLAIELPEPSEPAGAAFGRITRRKGVDLATINLVALVTASGTARFAFGAVAPTPILVSDATGALGAEQHDTTVRTAALAHLVASARPISDVRGSRDYRLAMLRVMSERTWTRAVAQLREKLAGGRSA